MLDKLTREDFDKLVGETFEIDFGEAGTVDADLAETAAGLGSGKHREPFSILLTCPRQTPAMQGIYKLHHAGLGELELFLVPVSSDDQGVSFEAIFS